MNFKTFTLIVAALALFALSAFVGNGQRPRCTPGAIDALLTDCGSPQ